MYLSKSSLPSVLHVHRLLSLCTVWCLSNSNSLPTVRQYCVYSISRWSMMSIKQQQFADSLSVSRVHSLGVSRWSLMSIKQQQFADSLSVLRVHSLGVSRWSLMSIKPQQYCVYIDSCQSVQFDVYLTAVCRQCQYCVYIRLSVSRYSLTPI